MSKKETERLAVQTATIGMLKHQLEEALAQTDPGERLLAFDALNQNVTKEIVSLNNYMTDRGLFGGANAACLRDILLTTVTVGIYGIVRLGFVDRVLIKKVREKNKNYTDTLQTVKDEVDIHTKMLIDDAHIAELVRSPRCAEIMQNYPYVAQKFSAVAAQKMINDNKNLLLAAKPAARELKL